MQQGCWAHGVGVWVVLWVVAHVFSSVALPNKVRMLILAALSEQSL